MAKTLTWADMPTGITQGSPTNRCPTYSMIKSALVDGYYLKYHEPINATDNQLLTKVTVSLSMMSTFTVKLNTRNTSPNLGGISTNVVIKYSSELLRVGTTNSPGSTDTFSKSGTFTGRNNLINVYTVDITGYCFTGSVTSYRIISYNGSTIDSGNFSSDNSFIVNFPFSYVFGNYQNSTSLILSVQYS